MKQVALLAILFLFSCASETYTETNSGYASAAAKPPPPKNVQLPKGPEKPVSARPKTKEACVAINGTWRRGGKLGNYVCHYAPVDAGKICLSNNDCSGFCEVKLLEKWTPKSPKERRPRISIDNIDKTAGQCSLVKPRFGCFELFDKAAIDKGFINTICID